MNIVIINHYFIPPTEAGGTRHYTLARYLIERGHSVTIVASNFNHFSKKYIAEKNKISVECLEGIRVIWLPTPSYCGNSLARIKNMLSFAWQCYSKCSVYFDKPVDCVIGSSPHLFAALAARLFAKRYKAKFMLEIRDLWPETLVLLGNISRLHPFIITMKIIERYLYKTSDQIVTLLPNAHEYIARYATVKKISWLPNFVDLTKFKIRRSDKNEIFKIMYVGSHGLANQLDLLIDAAKILNEMPLTPKIQLILVGDGPDKKRLKNSAVDCLNIIFKDPVPKLEIPQVLQEADAFILVLADSPLYQWGISLNKLYDYMAMEKPIIFVGTCSNNPIAQLGSGLHVTTYDPESIAQAMMILSQNDNDENERMGKLNRQFVQSQHELLVIGDKLELLVSECKSY